mmetsp:Transcript_17883/g.38525  ORF Transcript_17883/g.38525 Transcript_17883/m.38525 type:complete len:240 (+) Transcript_17883:538-1257(+)
MKCTSSKSVKLQRRWFGRLQKRSVLYQGLLQHIQLLPKRFVHHRHCCSNTKRGPAVASASGKSWKVANAGPIPCTTRPRTKEVSVGIRAVVFVAPKGRPEAACTPCLAGLHWRCCSSPCCAFSSPGHAIASVEALRILHGRRTWLRVSCRPAVCVQRSCWREGSIQPRPTWKDTLAASWLREIRIRAASETAGAVGIATAIAATTSPLKKASSEKVPQQTATREAGRQNRRLPQTEEVL